MISSVKKPSNFISLLYWVVKLVKTSTYIVATLTISLLHFYQILITKRVNGPLTIFIQV